MNKCTLFVTAAIAMVSASAQAELMDKYFYKVSTENTEGWTIQDADNTVLTPGKSYLEAKLNKNAGRMLNRFWNEEAWTKVSDLSTLPNNTYKFTMDLNMSNMATRADMEFVLLPVGACTASDSRVSTHNYHWANQQDAASATEETPVEDFFFRWRVMTAPAAANGDFTIIINEQPIGYTTAYNKYNLWPTTENPDSLFVMSSQTLYKFAVDINVAAKTATYTIADQTGTVLKTGVHNYVCAEDRAGIMVFSMNGTSTHQISNIGLSYQKEGPFAAEPSAELFWVEGAERDYIATFKEGEVLHWIQLGDAEDVVSGESYTAGEEYSISYGDATDTKDFEQGEDFGRKIITCNESGTLKIWTSMAEDETNTSDVVEFEVECAEVAFPAPTATITNVTEGYGKEYKISVDNSEVPLKPTITIHYTMSDGTSGDILSGETVTFTAAGTAQFYCWDKTHKSECYGRSETITITNDVEYVVADKKDFKLTIDEINAGKTGFHTNEVVDASGKSHWDRIMSNEKRGYKADGNNEVYDADNAADYVWVKEGHGLFADTDCGTDNAKWNTLVADNVRETCLPLYPSEEDVTLYVENAWAYFPYEGVVYYDVNSTAAVKKNEAGAAGYVEMKIEDKYISDDENKPNFYIVNKTSGYNRPDKGDCTSTEVIVAGKIFWLFRYDTAISGVTVLTYKGFESGLSEIAADKQESAIYNLNGIRVKNATSGLYIQNGKVIMVK